MMVFSNTSLPISSEGGLNLGFSWEEGLTQNFTGHAPAETLPWAL